MLARWTLATAAFWAVIMDLGFAQSGVMTTSVDSLDGNQRDLAGPADVTTAQAELERVHSAQGRRLAMHVVANRERQFFGEPDYPTDLTAVELDEARNLLFVLTADTTTGIPGLTKHGDLEVYNVTNPAAPVITHVEPVTGVDIRIIAEDQKLLLIQQQKVVVYDYQGATSLTKIGESELITGMEVLCPTDSGPRKVVQLRAAAVQVDGSTRRVFLTCLIQHSRVPLAFFKGHGIVALDLTGYPTTPTFYDHIFEDYPCPAPGDPFADPPSKWSVRDVAVTKQPDGHWYLCTVGATQYGAKVFLLDHFDSIGFDRYEEETLFGPGIQDYLLSVDVVGPDLAILSRHYSISAQIQNLDSSAVDATESGEGPPRDTLLMVEGSPTSHQEHLWTMTLGTGASHRFRIRDVSSLDGPPLTLESYYAPGDSDTSVYVPALGSVYCSTFHGVVRYDVSLGTEAVPDYDSYAPAVDPVTGELQNIEHMIGVPRAWSKPGIGSGDWQLFGSSATGGFTEWGVKTDGRPVLLRFVDGVAAGAWPAWATNATVAKYGQDVEYGIDPHNGHEIVVLDFYNYTTGEIAINLYDLTLGAWGAHMTGPTTDLGVPIVRATPWDVTLDGEWVFVGGERGFFVAKLNAGAGISTLQFMDYAETHDAGAYPAGPVGPPGQPGWSFQQVRGIQRVGNRLFVSLSDEVIGGVNRFALAMYEFHPDTSGGENLGDVGEAPLSVLFDGEGGQPDHFVSTGSDPEVYISGGGRLRAFTHNGVTHLFCCTQNGYVLQVGYDHATDVLSSVPLRFWHNGAYYNETNDCQVTNLAPSGSPPDLRLTVSKWAETFAIVEPFDV